MSFDKAAKVALSVPAPTQSSQLKLPSIGLARVIFAILAIWALVVFYREISQLGGMPSEPPSPRVISAIAATIYVMIAVSLFHNGPRMRRMALTGLIFEFGGVMITTAIGLFVSPASTVAVDCTMWGMAGTHYYFLPVIFPLLGMAWMGWSSPARIAAV